MEQITQNLDAIVSVVAALALAGMTLFGIYAVIVIKIEERKRARGEGTPIWDDHRGEWV